MKRKDQDSEDNSDSDSQGFSTEDVIFASDEDPDEEQSEEAEEKEEEEEENFIVVHDDGADPSSEEVFYVSVITERCRNGMTQQEIQLETFQWSIMMDMNILDTIFMAKELHDQNKRMN